MANSKITELSGYDPLDVKPNDVMVIVDVELDKTLKITLSDLKYILDENDFELSKLKHVQLTHNRSTEAGVSWVVNPSVYSPGYLPGAVTPPVPPPTLDDNFISPVKLKFKPHDCCKDKWPSLPHVVLRPGATLSTEYRSLMTIQYCDSPLATITFSHAYLGDSFIFITETGVEVSKYNTGQKLKFVEGLVKI